MINLWEKPLQERPGDFPDEGRTAGWPGRHRTASTQRPAAPAPGAARADRPSAGAAEDAAGTPQTAKRPPVPELGPGPSTRGRGSTAAAHHAHLAHGRGTDADLLPLLGGSSQCRALLGQAEEGFGKLGSALSLPSSLARRVAPCAAQVAAVAGCGCVLCCQTGSDLGQTQTQNVIAVHRWLTPLSWYQPCRCPGCWC